MADRADRQDSGSIEPFVVVTTFSLRACSRATSVHSSPPTIASALRPIRRKIAARVAARSTSLVSASHDASITRMSGSFVCRSSPAHSKSAAKTWSVQLRKPARSLGYHKANRRPGLLLCVRCADSGQRLHRLYSDKFAPELCL